MPHADDENRSRRPQREDDHERYESWRYRPSRVPPRSYQEFRDRGDARAEGQWSAGRGVGSGEGVEDEAYRDDSHGGNAGATEGAASPTYVGRMRRYRGTHHHRMRAERGPHAGLGPRGYGRSPERIREDVCDLLTEDGLLDARDIEVKVEGSEVTLKGTVPDRPSKRRAEDLAERISGVVDVHNRLRIAEARER